MSKKLEAITGSREERGGQVGMTNCPLGALSGGPHSAIHNLNKCVLDVLWEKLYLRRGPLPEGFTIQLARENT